MGRLFFRGNGTVRAALNGILKLPASAVSPYIVAGPAVYNAKFNFDDAEVENALKELGVELSQTKFAVQGGVGLQFNLSGMSSHLEAKLVNVFTEDSDARFIPITFGIMFGGGTPRGSRIRSSRGAKPPRPSGGAVLSVRPHPPRALLAPSTIRAAT